MTPIRSRNCPEWARNRTAAHTIVRRLEDRRRALLVVNATLGTAVLASAVVALYLLKSLLGIDLIDGPSPLHGLYVGLGWFGR